MQKEFLLSIYSNLSIAVHPLNQRKNTPRAANYNSSKDGPFRLTTLAQRRSSGAVVASSSRPRWRLPRRAATDEVTKYLGKVPSHTLTKSQRFACRGVAGFGRPSVAICPGSHGDRRCRSARNARVEIPP